MVAFTNAFTNAEQQVDHSVIQIRIQSIDPNFGINLDYNIMLLKI